MHDDVREQILDHLQHRRLGQAQYHLRRLVQEYEGDAATRSLLALCLAELEQFDEAVEQARHAVRLAPDEPYCHWAMAIVLASRRQFRAALPHAERAVDLAPDDADYWALLAQCHGASGSWQQALSAAANGFCSWRSSPAFW